MIEHLQINDVAPCVRYRSDGVQAAFIFPFAVFKAADMEVWVDNERVTAGVTVSGVGISSGGSVLFGVPPATGRQVTLRRRMALARTSDFQTDGIIRAKTLNDELDYQVAAVQQVADDVSRCVQRPFTSGSTADLRLPDPIGGRGLKWSADGASLENSAADLDEAVTVATAQATAAGQSRAGADADRAAVAADRVAVGADRQIVAAAAVATSADRVAVAADREAVTVLHGQAQQAASDAEASARSVGARLVGHCGLSLPVAKGALSLAMEPGKGWVAGMPITIAATGQPLCAMTGTVTAYDVASGHLDVLVEEVSGAGTYSDWIVVISGRRGAPGTGVGDLLAAKALGEIAALGATAQQNARASLGLASVAASGAYADLSGKPPLGSAAAATLGTAAGQVPTAEQVAGLVQGVPTGSIISFGGSAAPTGWLLCDGSAVSRTGYAPLFAAIGTVHGAGNGSTTFNLPDLRGRVALGAGQGSGLTARVLGGKLGAETHTLSISEMPSHNHSNGAGGSTVATASELNFSVATPGGTGSSGGGVAHNNMPPALVLNAIIKI